MSKLTVHCREWREYERNTLRGFATFYIPQLQLVIKDCPVHAKNGQQWVQFPARPMLDDKRELVRNTDGKIQYATILQWESRDVAHAFSAAAIKAIQDFELGIVPAEAAS